MFRRDKAYRFAGDMFNSIECRSKFPNPGRDQFQEDVELFIGRLRFLGRH